MHKDNTDTKCKQLSYEATTMENGDWRAEHILPRTTIGAADSATVKVNVPLTVTGDSERGGGERKHTFIQKTRPVQMNDSTEWELQLLRAEGYTQNSCTYECRYTMSVDVAT